MPGIIGIIYGMKKSELSWGNVTMQVEQILKDNFGWIIAGVIVIGGTLGTLKIRSVYKKGGSILYED